MLFNCELLMVVLNRISNVPVIKKRRREEDPDRNVMVQFTCPDGNPVGPTLDLPLSTNADQFGELLQGFLSSDEKHDAFTFMLEPVNLDGKPLPLAEINGSLFDIFNHPTFLDKINTESVVPVKYFPLAKFKIRPVSRCTAALEGHKEAILTVEFSPDGSRLASGSGDTTIRLWDLCTETPEVTLTGHKHWVLRVLWSPDAQLLASGDMAGDVRIWRVAERIKTPAAPKAGSTRKKAPPAVCPVPFTLLKGHKKPITDLCWQPLHLWKTSAKLVTACGDATAVIYDATSGLKVFTLSCHTKPITQVRWSGIGGNEGTVFTASRDTTIKMWDASTGTMIKELKGHAHWVNSLALNSDYVLRTGCFDHTGRRDFSGDDEKKAIARKRYEDFLKDVGMERLASCSDDNTLFLWAPQADCKPVNRMTGHQQTVNCIRFSPDGKYIASAAFDKSVRLWEGRTGKFIHTLRGHVQRVYQVSWAADSRHFVSASADSTVKLWSVREKRLLEDLPGHADEVYAIDWSPDGARVCSGSKDRILKIWRH